MEASIRQAVEQLIAGDLSTGAAVYQTSHDQLLDAIQGAQLLVTRAAVARVLQGLAAGGVSAADAQSWASFVRRGYSTQASSGPIQALPIDYERQFEDVIVEAISRLDELGDAIDGNLEPKEIEGLLAELEAGTRP